MKKYLINELIKIADNDLIKEITDYVKVNRTIYELLIYYCEIKTKIENLKKSEQIDEKILEEIEIQRLY